VTEELPRSDEEVATEAAMAVIPRLLLVGVLWGLTLPVRDSDATAFEAIVNAALAVLSWWAAWPGWRNGGPSFGGRGSNLREKCKSLAASPIIRRRGRLSSRRRTRR